MGHNRLVAKKNCRCSIIGKMKCMKDSFLGNIYTYIHNEIGNLQLVWKLQAEFAA